MPHASGEQIDFGLSMSALRLTEVGSIPLVYCRYSCQLPMVPEI